MTAKRRSGALESNRRNRSALRRFFGIGWVAAFLAVGLSHYTDVPPTAPTYVTLAAIGALYALLADRERLFRMIADYRGIWWCFLGVAWFLLVSEIASSIAFHHDWDMLIAYQSALLACLPTLALFLTDSVVLDFAFALFAAASLWHLFAMPVEAITGAKLSWFPPYPIERNSWIFHYQASGLAFARYYWSGFYLPIFYVAWGAIREGGVFARRGWQKLGIARSPVFLALPLLWLFAVLASQSRASFVGAGIASLLCVLGPERLKRARRFAVPALLAVGAGFLIYQALLVSNKSGVEYRWPYMKLYFFESLKWPQILIGHGSRADRWGMIIPNTLWLYHSHNDLIEVFYIWGLPTLLAYIGCWCFIIRLVGSGYLKRGVLWPLCALIALFPNMLTDLGFVHLEKALFMGVFACVIMALEFRRKYRII